MALLLVAFHVPFSPTASADINPQINFQGKLTNPDGTNVTNGTYSIVFSIYTVSSGGSSVWTETQSSVSVTDGIFRVSLGSITPLPGSVDFNSNSLHLGIQVGADAEMTPRVQFTAAPYAFNSQRLGGLTADGFIRLGNATAQADATTNNSIFLNKTAAGNIVLLQSSGTDVFSVTGAGNILLGQNADKTISVAQTASNAGGQDLTLIAGQGGAGAGANAGGATTIQGGQGGGTNGDGGSVILAGGAASGSGLAGNVTVRNAANSTTAFQVQNAAGTTTVLAVDTVGGNVNVNGGVNVNTVDSSIVKTSSADFALGTVGASILNANGQLELNDGTIPNAGRGTITTAGQPATSGAIAAGALAISRPDGRYLVLRGGGTGMDIYDSITGTFTNSAQVLNGVAGAGSLAFPRPTGQYRIIHGGGLTTTSLVDPQGNIAVGGSVAVTASNAGTIAHKRPDGRYIFTNGGAASTQVYNPIADNFAAGPALATGTSGAGSLFLPRNDGSGLLINGGVTSTTNVYNPTTGAGDIGAFTAGPSLDGNQAAGTCGINGAGSVALRKADGKYLILSRVNVSATYDPVANTITCSTTGPATALGDGAHAIPYHDGKFLIIVGGNSTLSYVYDQNAGTFTVHNTALTAVTTGAFSLMRQNGTWQIITGTDTCTTGCSNNLDLGMPMNGATARYTTEDISTTSLNEATTLKWTAQLEAIYAAASNGTTNSAFSAMQFFVRTATNSSGCTTPLNSAIDKEITVNGDFIRPSPTDNCVRISVQMNRPLPKRIIDERGTWTGNSSTISRLDFVTPTLFDLALDNSTVLHRDSFNFNAPGSQENSNGTIPTAITSNAPTAGGACTAGNHFWFVTYVTNGVESRLSPTSAVQNCTGPNGTVSLTTIPTGPSGTTARKIYRTKAAALATDTPYLLTTINDNVTTIFSDTLADTSLGAAYTYIENSGPIGTRVEAAANLGGSLTLPTGRVPGPTATGTTGFYAGVISGAHPNLNQAQTNQSTIVIARPNRTFVVIASLTAPAANASIYDPATQIFTAQAGTSIPTAANGTGGFALKRPDGKYFVVLGNNTATTNIYDPVTNTFSLGPAMTAAIAGVGASAILNSDGTYTIVHGNALTSTTLYDPIRNTTSAGPVTTTAVNCGFWAIPLKNGQYKVFPGVADGIAGVTTSMNYDPRTKSFTAGIALASAHGCGSFTFQRQDGFWLTVSGGAGVAGADVLTTNLINPDNGTAIAGPALSGVAGTSGPRRGAHVIPRADGTFLIIHGRQVTNTTIYFPWGGTFGVGAGIGTAAAGPALTAAADSGALSFQRPDGKWVIINGNATQTTMLYDAGWYGDGQYLSEQMQVPAMPANSTLNWKQTNDNFVRFEVRYASSQAALATAPYYSIARPGQSIANPGGETWAQIEINLRRDFPTFPGTLDGVYVSGGGLVFGNRAISQPTVMSYSINNGRDLLTLQNNGLDVFRVTSDGSVYSSSRGGFYSGGADLAENYSSTENLSPGEVVIMDSVDNKSVKRSTNQYQESILGVVSTEPGFVAGAFTENSHPIALVGRVPVKISTENGDVKQGDFLTSASIPGYAMKATVSGRVLGTALEGFDSSKATPCPQTGLGSQSETLCGQVMMFVNLTNYQGASVDALMDQAPSGSFVGEAILPGFDYHSINGLSSDNSRQENILGYLKSLRDKQASGQSPEGGEILTNRLSAVNEVISPVIVTDLLRANKIQANSIEGLEIYTDKIAALEDSQKGLVTTASATSNSTAINQLERIQAKNGYFTIGLVSLGQIEARGGLVVDGASQFNGRTTFAAMVQFMGNVEFTNDILAKGRVTFNKDSGGSVAIKKTERRISVVFDKPYQEKPIITASVTIDRPKDQLTPQEEAEAALREQTLFDAGYSYLVSDVSTKGFTIVLNKPAAEDITFSWNAISVQSDN